MDISKSIAVIDLGGQYCHLIARRLRELGYRAFILDHDASAPDVRQYAGVILSGGPNSVYAEGSLQIDPQILETGNPILGICYGHQLLAQRIGGRVERGRSEFGSSALSVLDDSPLFGASPKSFRVWMSHSDSVVELPPGVRRIGATAACATAAFADEERHLYGVQFHPEVDHTEYGTELLRNFAAICKLEPRDPDASRVQETVDDIRAKVAEGSVFFLVSGGVDSMVAFALCARALGRDRVFGLYVDTGFMRLREADELRHNLAGLGLDDRVHVRDASARFFDALKDVDDPETKRKIIGGLFVETQAAAMREYGIDEEHWYLGQGTIYPDTIESGGKKGTAALIKTHHNRCAEILALMERGRVVEPLAELYKDEVRQVGAELGLNSDLLSRWPFPGPGLAIRVLCTTAHEASRATVIHDGATDDSMFSGYRAVALPIRTVGVQGDVRTYRQMVALEGPHDYDRLHAISSRLCNEGDEYNRVAYVVATRGDRPIASGVVARAMLTRDRVEILQRADAIVRELAGKHGLLSSIWQFPVILLPIRIDGRETVVLRPVESDNGMTANFTRLEPAVLDEIAGRILAECGVGAVLLDVTDKPPATIEWE
jgi:GMP synthase (glutamine-hydrolysing)